MTLKSVKIKKIIWSGGLLLLTTFLSHASVLNGNIDGFRLFRCGAVFCMKISSDTAYVGKYDGNYAFDKAKLVLINRKTKTEQIFESEDVYYDQLSDYIYLRDSSAGRGLFFNINKQILTPF